MASDKSDSYFPASILDSALSERHSTTTLIDTIFIPGKRVPNGLINKMNNDPDLLAMALLAEAPLIANRVSQPYWAKGQNKRDFDTVDIEVFSAVCLADDRHLLEGICAVGGLFSDLSGLTLRMAFELADFDCHIENLLDRHYDLLDKKIFTQKHEFFLVEFAVLFEFLGNKNTKENKKTVFSRLKRLAQMLIQMRFSKDGEQLPKKNLDIHLIDKDFIPLLSFSNLRNKKQVNSDTYTHVLVGVNKSFTASMKEEGAISRKRFKEVYPQLAGRHSVTDFSKWIDRHKREYISGKYLSDLVRAYYEEKALIVTTHLSTQMLSTTKEFLDKKDIILKEYGFLLKEKIRLGKTDYIFEYLDKVTRDAITN